LHISIRICRQSIMPTRRMWITAQSSHRLRQNYRWIIVR